MNRAEARYLARFCKVLEFIDTNLQSDLDLDRLSSVAAFSKFHFQRQFTEIFAIGVHKYVQLMRMKRACYQLAFRNNSDERVVDIAVASGYDSSESFARAFKKSLRQTPSEFRAQPDWDTWHVLFQPINELRAKHMQTEYFASDVRIVDFKATRVAALDYRGDHRHLGEAIKKFIEWRKANNLPPKISATFNLLYNDPYQTPPDEYRIELCAATERPIGANDIGIVEKEIPAGRCAMMTNIGSEDKFGALFNFLYAQWLPQSGEELRDFPLFVRRVRFFPDVPENEAVAEIYLPLR